ncbi:Phosphoglycerol transferase MdoB [Flavobacterium phragmitis]|uniref:Phosphoglycerol transferase MdoB n=1 Tax=Flavobacterium phragmitis TaxID=739143 RepID=A0A1I1M6D5_9FLAO|nr:Phosphoglycerol transferase MdoB [Flavobacterium phragmitis]
MKNYTSSLKVFLYRYFLIFLVYQICNILFYALNTEYFDNITLQNIIGSILFDFSSISYITFIFLIAHAIPGNFKYRQSYQTILKISFFLVNLLFVAANLIDIIYFRFTGRRSTFSMITAKGMEKEALGLFFSFIIEFWYIPLLLIILSILFWKSIPNFKNKSEIKHFTKQKFLKQSFYFLTSAFLLLIIARGGFQKKPLRIVDAARYSSCKNAPLILNTSFCILKTIFQKDDIEKVNYFDQKSLDSIYKPILSFKKAGTVNKKNVVIIILESFGHENINKKQTPFLDSLITKSYYFKNGFANGKVSIDAVPSIISSIPSLMNNSFIISSYSLNKTNSLPKILKKEGYATSFFHGAFNGSQNFDQYSKASGFEQYYGKDEYIGPEAFDGKWGIFDEEFLQFFAKKLSTFKEPFFSSIFTISSHNPYRIPERYKNKFPKGTTVVQESIAYTDYSLKLFFEKAKTQKWYNNTLFVISADHTSSSGESEIDKTIIGKFHIPILFFDPGNPNFYGANEKNFQQIDIMPSIVEYLGIKTDLICFGKSFKSDQNFAVFYLQGIYHCVQDEYYLAFANNQVIGLYNWKKDPLLKNDLQTKNTFKTLQISNFLKAYIQNFNERVIDNRLSI